MTLRRRAAVAGRPLILLLLGGLACNDLADAPAHPPVEASVLNAPFVSSRLREVRAALESRPMLSLATLAPLMFSPSSQAARSGFAGAGACASSPPTPLVHVMHRASTPLLPDSLRGRGYVMDPLQFAWRWMGDTTGPADGVRFALDEVNDLGGLSDPVTADGLFALRDVGHGSLQLRLDGNHTGVARYDAAVASDTLPFGVLSSGTLVGRRAFLWTDSVAEDGRRIQLAGRLTDPVRGLTIRLAASRTVLDFADNDYLFDFTLSGESGSARIAGSVSTFCFLSTTQATVYLDDTPFAQLQVAFGETSITRLDGEPLTNEEQAAVLDLRDTQMALFRGLVALYRPVGQLLRLGAQCTLFSACLRSTAKEIR